MWICYLLMMYWNHAYHVMDSSSGIHAIHFTRVILLLEPLMPSCFFLFLFWLVSVFFLLRALPSAVHIVMVGDPKYLPQLRATIDKKQVLHSSLSHRWYQLVWQLSTWPSSLWALNLTGSNSGCCYRMMSLCMFCVRLAGLRLVVKRSRLDPS